jgi:hypothetical protein
MRMKITAKKLYEAVWTKPVRTLAKEWGLSDTGLAKICRKNGIPLPRVGHWARGAVERCFDRRHTGGQTIYDWRHYLAVLQRKPGALRNGAPFLELPDAFKCLQALLMKHPGGDREMVEILALVLHHDEQAVLSAVELALESGVPTKLHVLNLLSRLVELPPPAPITTPQDLVLNVEPQANVIRYDSLREKRHAA